MVIDRSERYCCNGQAALIVVVDGVSKVSPGCKGAHRVISERVSLLTELG